MNFGKMLQLQHPAISELGEFYIVQSLEQVRLKELELTGLKHQNKNLEGFVLERDRERNNLEAKCA